MSLSVSFDGAKVLLFLNIQTNKQKKLFYFCYFFDFNGISKHKSLQESTD